MLSFCRRRRTYTGGPLAAIETFCLSRRDSPLQVKLSVLERLRDSPDAHYVVGEWEEETRERAWMRGRLPTCTVTAEEGLTRARSVSGGNARWTLRQSTSTERHASNIRNQSRDLPPGATLIRVHPRLSFPPLPPLPSPPASPRPPTVASPLSLPQSRASRPRRWARARAPPPLGCARRWAPTSGSA